VPAAAEVFSPQSAHIHNPVPVRQQSPLPLPGHENPVDVSRDALAPGSTAALIMVENT
jgi:hypothetical protein